MISGLNFFKNYNNRKNASIFLISLELLLDLCKIYNTFLTDINVGSISCLVSIEEYFLLIQFIAYSTKICSGSWSSLKLFIKRKFLELKSSAERI